MAKTQSRRSVRRVVHDPGRFLDLPPQASGYEKAKAVILPLPLEASVSYGGGTAAGPKAIIEASRQVELYDPRSDLEPAMLYGVHTLPVPEFFGDGRASVPEKLDRVGVLVAKHLAAGKLVVGLGGEHTVSLGVAKGVAKAAGDFTLVHVDAHADLRDKYEGDPFSHACVVRRIAELPECEAVLQLGIRSTTREQVDFSDASERPVMRTWYAWDIHEGKKSGWRREFKKLVRGRKVFFTFDVDGLDPAIVPATGTPEPDGLDWREFMKIVSTVAEEAEVVAMDCVELAPVAGLHHADFTVARALYAMLNAFIEH